LQPGGLFRDLSGRELAWSMASLYPRSFPSTEGDRPPPRWGLADRGPQLSRANAAVLFALSLGPSRPPLAQTTDGGDGRQAARNPGSGRPWSTFACPRARRGVSPTHTCRGDALATASSHAMADRGRRLPTESPRSVVHRDPCTLLAPAPIARSSRSQSSRAAKPTAQQSPSPARTATSRLRPWSRSPDSLRRRRARRRARSRVSHAPADRADDPDIPLGDPIEGAGP